MKNGTRSEGARAQRSYVNWETDNSQQLRYTINFARRRAAAPASSLAGSSQDVVDAGRQRGQQRKLDLQLPLHACTCTHVVSTLLDHLLHTLMKHIAWYSQ